MIPFLLNDEKSFVRPNKFRLHRSIILNNKGILKGILEKINNNIKKEIDIY